MSRDDPYHDRKRSHMAEKIRSDGAVKALCFQGNKPINLRVALWTMKPEQVTCEKCRKLIAVRHVKKKDRANS